MNAPDVLIDLGERRPPEQGVPRSRRGVVRRNWPVVSVALAVLLAAVLTASRRPPELIDVAVLSVEELAHPVFSLDADALYLLSDSPINDGEVHRYRLRDGREGWRLAADRDGRFFGVTVLGGLLIVLGGICPSLRDAEIFGVDRTTGRVRWRHPGRLLGSVPGTSLVVAETRPGEERCGEPPWDPVEVTQGVPAFAAASVDVVDLTTGATRWSWTPGSGQQMWYGSDSAGSIRQIVSTDRSGAIQMRDAATGRVNASGRIPEAVATGPAPRGQPVRGASMVHDLLLFPREVPGGVTLTAYSSRSLARLWTATVVTHPAVEIVDTPWYSSCDRYLCVHSLYGLVAIDPANGSIGWRLEQAHTLVSGARWMLVSATGAPDSGLRLVDARTGRLGSALTDYQMRGTFSGDSSRLVLIRTGGRDTIFTTLDLGTGRQRFLGRAKGAYNWCEATERHLACLTGIRSVRLWRFAG